MIAAALTMAAFGAAAVTTNRVTVTSDSGSSMTYGSLAYWVKNAPTNGSVFEITVPHDMVCLLDEPLKITSEQSIVIRSEINPTLKPPFSLLPSGGTIAFTHTLYATEKDAFDVRGFLRLEQMGLGNAARYGSGAGVFLAYSRALFENSLLYVGSVYATTQHASDAEGTLLYSSGGSMTMANCICASQSSKCAFYFTGSNVYYGSRMGELWEADFTQVNDPSTVIGSTVREKTVRGVQQAYYDLQVNLPPAPPVT